MGKLLFCYDSHIIKAVAIKLKVIKDKIRNKPYAPKVGVFLIIQEIEQLLNQMEAKEENNGS